MGELNNSRPVIEIELIRQGSGQTNKGAISKNSQDEPTFIGDAIWHFELHWEFYLIIRNNSSFPAYDIELLFKEGKFDYIDKINPKIPILPHTEKILSAKYNRSFEGMGSESNKLIADTLPDDINQIRILSNYVKT